MENNEEGEEMDVDDDVIIVENIRERPPRPSSTDAIYIAIPIEPLAFLTGSESDTNSSGDSVEEISDSSDDQRESPEPSSDDSPEASVDLEQESSNQHDENQDSNTATPVATSESNEVTPSPCKKRRLENDIDDDDGTICPICYDKWNSGDHRICSLKCGHIFGSSCIERWLISENKKTCPTCKKKIRQCDLRYLYVRKLVALDTSALDELRTENSRLIEERNRVKLEFAKILCQEHNLKREVTECQQRIQELSAHLKYSSDTSAGPSTSYSAKQNERIHMYMDKSLDICKEGGCRVIDFRKDLDLLLASIKSPNTLFGNGYGIRKINITNYKPTGYIHLHQKAIRDIKFHPQEPWILSVGLDNAIKVTNTTTNSTVASYTGDSPLWACCWDATNPNYLYVGEQQGAVIKYDVRELNRPICSISVAGNMAPVVSVASIASDPIIDFPNGGVLCCKLNSVWVFKNTSLENSEYSQRSLPMEGPFVSMSYQNSTRHLLVSARPNERTPYARHMLCCIESNEENNLVCNMVHNFQGGSTQKLLSRSCLFSRTTEYVAAHLETTKSVCLWSVNSGRRVCALPAHEPILDICRVETDDVNLLACLTAKKIEFFKFIE